MIHKIKVPSGSEVSLLGVPGNQKSEANGIDLVIQVPPLNGDQLPCLYAYSFKNTGERNCCRSEPPQVPGGTAPRDYRLAWPALIRSANAFRLSASLVSPSARRQRISPSRAS